MTDPTPIFIDQHAWNAMWEELNATGIVRHHEPTSDLGLQNIYLPSYPMFVFVVDVNR